MSDTAVTGIRDISITKRAAKKQDSNISYFKKLKKSGSLVLIAAMFSIGAALALAGNIPVKNVMKNYSYDVLVILMVMELFTNLIAETNIMQLIAVKIAEISKGRKRLNNITAVMMILPVIFVLLKTLELDKKYVSVFFAAVLALSNTGGAASPVGDFPAIVIMTSGITTFLSYLTHAFPLFALTSAILITVWGMHVKREDDDGAIRRLAVSNLKSQYRNINVRFDVLKLLCVVFTGMFLAWSFVPQDIMPPEMIAVLGYGAAMLICSLKGLKIEQKMDLRSVLTIASFLFFAEVISETGVLRAVAGYMQANIADPKLLVMAIMLITSIVAGIFSAGPAAAAMMPIITELCNGPLNAQSDWIAVAYAAAICAGSSLFMWSATAGFILSGKVNAAGITDISGDTASWGVAQYFKYGAVNYLIQISVALIAMAVIL